MAVTKPLMTAEEFIRLPDAEGKQELVGGRVVEMVPVGDSHGIVQLDLGALMRQANRRGGRGRVMVETGFRLARNPDTVRAPDIAYISRERHPTVTGSFVDAAPDIAVEVMSPDDRPSDINRKVREYLVAGVNLVWVVNQKRQVVTVYAPGVPARTLRGTDVLSGEDVLPELAVRVGDLFEE